VKYLICGFSGAGKTYALQKLRENPAFKQFQFLDLDQEIARCCGYSEDRLGDLIKEKGWSWFRDFETETLHRLVQEYEFLWLALGGGSLTDKNEAYLQGQSDIQIYWLDTPFEICWERIKNDKNRPLVLQGEQEIKKIFEKRLETYKKYPKFIY
jgi:shikimate kinase